MANVYFLKFHARAFTFQQLSAPLILDFGVAFGFI